jgi:hypothetical protein
VERPRFPLESVVPTKVPSSIRGTRNRRAGAGVNNLHTKSNRNLLLWKTSPYDEVQG